MKKTYQIVTRAAKESAAVVEQFCQSNGQILLPIVNLIESASQVVENVIHEIQIHALETIFMLSAEKIAGQRTPGKPSGEIRWHGSQPGKIKLALEFLALRKPAKCLLQAGHGLTGLPGIQQLTGGGDFFCDFRSLAAGLLLGSFPFRLFRCQSLLDDFSLRFQFVIAGMPAQSLLHQRSGSLGFTSIQELFRRSDLFRDFRSPAQFLLFGSSPLRSLLGELPLRELQLRPEFRAVREPAQRLLQAKDRLVGLLGLQQLPGSGDFPFNPFLPDSRRLCGPLPFRHSFRHALLRELQLRLQLFAVGVAAKRLLEGSDRTS